MRCYALELSHGWLVLLEVNSHQAGTARIGTDWLFTNPVLAMRHPFHHREVNLVDVAILEQLAINRHRAGAFDEEQHAGGFRIDPVNEAQKLQAARFRPEIAPCNR